jgi:flotillin
MKQEILEKEGQSQARLEEEKNRAAAITVMAKAEADRIEGMGNAEAAAVKAKLMAEADGLKERAVAFKEFGEAAILQSVVDRLPEIVENLTKPLMKTEKMVFITDDGAAASKFTGDMNKMLTHVPETVKALTGIDLQKSLKGLAGAAAEA